MNRLSYLLLFVFMGCTAGARSGPEPPERIEPPPNAPNTHAYSPYAVQLSGHPAFHRVTFKHVGSLLPTHDDPVFEVMAESMALALSVEAGYSAEVLRDETLLDPANHLACGAEHLYVDVWQTPHNGWGYSLWSGCSAEARFAIEDEVSAPQGPLIDRVAPLTRAVHDALKAADAVQCYRRTC